MPATPSSQGRFLVFLITKTCRRVVSRFFRRLATLVQTCFVHLHTYIPFHTSCPHTDVSCTRCLWFFQDQGVRRASLAFRTAPDHAATLAPSAGCPELSSACLCKLSKHMGVLENEGSLIVRLLVSESMLGSCIWILPHAGSDATEKSRTPGSPDALVDGGCQVSTIPSK